MDIEKKFEELGKVVHDFRTIAEKESAELKKGLTASATKESLDKAEAHITKLEKEIEDVKTAFNRSAQNQEVEDDKEAKQYSEEFAKYLKKGVDLSPAAMEINKKFMSTDDDSNGGFWVSGQTSSEIVNQVYESSPVRQLASVQTISGSFLEIMQDNGEVSGGGWVGEVAPRPATDTPKIGMIKIYAYEMYENPSATQTMLDDAAINVEQWLADKVSEKFGRREATAFVTGDGVSKPKGILAYDTSFVERVAAAGASAIVGDDLIKLQDAVLDAFQANASWMMHRSIKSGIRKLKSNDNQYLWVPGLSIGAQDTILGKPVYTSSDMNSAPVTTLDTIIYGDFKAGYQIVDRQGIRVLRDPFTNKPFVLFYTTKRVGAGVKNKQALKALKQA